MNVRGPRLHDDTTVPRPRAGTPLSSVWPIRTLRSVAGAMAEAKSVDANSAGECGRLLPENGGLLALRPGDARAPHVTSAVANVAMFPSLSPSEFRCFNALAHRRRPHTPAWAARPCRRLARPAFHLKRSACPAKLAVDRKCLHEALYRNRDCIRGRHHPRTRLLPCLPLTGRTA